MKGYLNMGKGTRKRDARLKEAKMLRVQEARAQRKKAKTRKNIIISVVSCVLVVAAIVGVCSGIVAVKESGVLLRNKISITSKNYQVDNAMLSYFIFNNYASFMNTYGSLATYYINPSYSLKKQDCMFSDEKISWFEYFADRAAETVKQYLILCEKAIEENITLTEDEYKTVELQMKTLNIDNYPIGLKEEDLKKCYEIMALATKYANVMKERYNITDAEIEAYYQKHIDSYLLTDYRSYYFEFTSSTDTSSSNTSSSSKMNKDEAKQKAEELKNAATSEEKFEEWVKEYIKEGYTDDKKLQEAVDKTLTEKATKKKDDKASEWMYNKDTKEGDTYIHESEKGFTVYYLVKAPYRDTAITKTVRHILLTKDTYGTLELAKKKADELVEEFKKNPSEEAFAKLVYDYSEDTGSTMVGGLYENIYEGEMVEEFNDWCFNKDRKAGDVDVVKTSYGYHIMYFVEDGLETWGSHCYNALLNEKYTEDCEEFEKNITVDINEWKINRINIF